MPVNNGPAEAYKGATRGPPLLLTEFGTGQLVSIQLEGFMAFKNPVEVFFSPYTNLIASCNGVGKSTIVSAIQFALGCRSTSGTAAAAAQKQQQQNQSQQQLQRFFTYGCRKASVCLRLKGPEREELVSIQRDLEKGEKGTQSTYYINGEEVRLCDVQKQKERLSLRVDNYLCFMQQEKVSLFGSLTPKDLLANTLQAINERDARCLYSLQQQQEKLHQLVAAHDTTQDRCLLLQQQQQVLQQQQQDLVNYYNLKRRLTLCHGCIMRLSAEEKLKAYRETKAKLLEARDSLEPQVQKLNQQKEALQQRRQSLQHNEETLQRQLQAAEKSREAVQAALDGINAKQQADDEAAAELDGCPAQLQGLMRRLQLQREKALDPQAQRLMLEETLQQLLNRRQQQQQRPQQPSIKDGDGPSSEQGHSKKPLQLPGSAKETEYLLQQQSVTLGELRRRLVSVTRQLRASHVAVQEATERLGLMQRLQQQRQQQLEQRQQQQQQQVLQALTRLETGFDMGAVSRGIRLLSTHKFKAPVEGPLGAIVAVTDRRYLGVAEHFLRAKLLSFLCVDSEADFLTVSKANLRCFALNPSAPAGRRPQLTSALREAGVDGFLMDYLTVPSAVKTTFQEYTLAHLCLLCRPDLSPEQEERMQQTARRELRQQGCPSQELVYYIGSQAHRLRQSLYDDRGFVHSVTNVPRGRAPLLRLQQQVLQHQGPEEEEEQQQQQGLQQQKETIQKLRQAEQQLEKEERQLARQEMEEKETRDLLREHLLAQQADAEQETKLRQRIASAAAAAAAQDQQYRALAAEIASLPSMSKHLTEAKKKRLCLLKQQLFLLLSATQHLRTARAELEPFKFKAAAQRKETERLRKEEERMRQAEEELANGQQKLVELQETLQQRRKAYRDAKAAAGEWEKGALGVYADLLHVLLPMRGAAEVETVCVEETITPEAALAADVSSSSNSSRGVLPPLSPLPDTVAELEALETRLKLQVERSSRIGHSAVEEIARNNREIRELQEETAKIQQQAHALHQTLKREAEDWMPRVEGVVSVLCERFRALIKIVSPKADGRISLPEVSPRGFAPPATAATAAAEPTQGLQLAPLPDFENLRLSLKVTFSETTPLRQLSNTNSGGERSLVAVLYLLAVQAFAQGSFRVLDEINQGLDSDREALLFSLVSKVAHGLRAAPAAGDTVAAIAATARDSAAVVGRNGSNNSSNSNKRQAPPGGSIGSVSKRHRTTGADADSADGERGETATGDSCKEEGGVQYILLTPHIIPKADLSSLAFQFIFSGPGHFTQAQFNLDDQIRRLLARRKDKPHKP